MRKSVKLDPRKSLAPAPAPRQLATELERVEQTITLTLQEIDRNFAHANRLVDQHILPTLDRYGSQSQQIREDSAFWRAFFESAAQVTVNFEEEGLETEHNDPYVPESPQAEAPATPRRATTPPTRIPQPRFTPKGASPRKEKDSTVTQNHDFNVAPQTPRPVTQYQVLDKRWKMVATPRGKAAGSQSFATPMSTRLGISLEDSPDIQPPQLQSDVFSRPVAPTANLPALSTTTSTPLRTRPNPVPFIKTPIRPGATYDTSDMDMDMGMSPPVTMALRQAQTPGGAQRVVANVLAQATGESDESFEHMLDSDDSM